MNETGHIYNIGTRAIAVLAFLAIMACSSDDADRLPSPPPDGKVAVELALNVATPSVVRGATRMSSATTQSNGEFRTIESVRMIPFDINNSPGVPFNLTLSTSPYTAGNSRHFLSNTLDLVIGTASFLCYAKPKDPVTATEGVIDEKFLNGSIVSMLPALAENTPANISFSPDQINQGDIASENEVSGSGRAAGIATYLTNIAKVTEWTDEVLAPRLESFKNKNNGVYLPIAGSSRNLEKWVNMLYSNIQGLTGVADIVAAIKDEDYVTYDSQTQTISFKEDYQFPVDLPDGVATIQWINYSENPENSKFEYQNTGRYNEYAYPAELCYYANSSIKTSTESKASSYADDKIWNTILADYDNGTVVTVDTRSVALTEPLQYGVSCLRTRIKAVPQEYSGGTGLLGYNADPQTDVVPLTASTDNTPGTFPLTAILVGGQTQQDYTLSPLFPDETAEGYDSANDPEYVIYDKSIANQGICLGDFQEDDFSTPVYTLVFQTKNDKSVKMVLEFLNNSGKDFQCEDGIIYDGTKFYMVASVVLAEGSEDHSKRIFTKDYMTTAQITISGLSKAYNSLPSLNSDKIRLFTQVQAGIRTWNNGQTIDHPVYNW